MADRRNGVTLDLCQACEWRRRTVGLGLGQVLVVRAEERGLQLYAGLI